jgi:hypothetical protein
LTSGRWTSPADRSRRWKSISKAHSWDWPRGSPYVEQLAQTSKSLENKGWETIVKVRDKGEHAYIAVKSDGNNIVGLVVLAADEDDEIVLVNIVGNINLDEIWRVGREFEIDHLDSVHQQSRKPKG